MGNTAKLPNKDKITNDGFNNILAYGSSSMQGWRATMEDAEVATGNFIGEDIGLFCVFDGHCGTDVSKFCNKYFPVELKKNQNCKKALSLKKEKKDSNKEIDIIIDNYILRSLEETFLKMDELLSTPVAEQE